MGHIDHKYCIHNTNATEINCTHSRHIRHATVIPDTYTLRDTYHTLDIHTNLQRVEGGQDGLSGVLEYDDVIRVTSWQ